MDSLHNLQVNCPFAPLTGGKKPRTMFARYRLRSRWPCNIGKTKKPPLDANPFGGFFWLANVFSSNRGCRKYLRGEFFAPKGKKEGLAKPLFFNPISGGYGGLAHHVFLSSWFILKTQFLRYKKGNPWNTHKMDTDFSKQYSKSIRTRETLCHINS